MSCASSDWLALVRIIYTIHYLGAAVGAEPTVAKMPHCRKMYAIFKQKTLRELRGNGRSIASQQTVPLRLVAKMLNRGKAAAVNNQLAPIGGAVWSRATSATGLM